MEIKSSKTICQFIDKWSIYVNIYNSSIFKPVKILSNTVAKILTNDCELCSLNMTIRQSFSPLKYCVGLKILRSRERDSAILYRTHYVNGK